MIALACASHVLVDLPLFGGPVLALATGIVLITRAERRRAASAPATATINPPTRD